MDFQLHFGDKTLIQDQVEYLERNAVDYALMNDVLVQSKMTPGKAELAPFMLFPTPFPKKLFDEAKEVQQDFNLLVHKVSQDHEFLEESLKGTVKADKFTGRLYDIYEKTRNEGIAQPITLGIVRSDYMLQSDKETVVSIKECNENLSIKQVELNTIAVGGGCICARVAELGSYVLGLLDKEIPVGSPQIPRNTVISGIAEGLAQAWELYGSRSAIVLISTLREDMAKYDQVQIEYYLHNRCPRLKAIRRTFEEVYKTAKLDNKKLIVDGYEVAVVYHRYGIDPREYPSENAWSARLLIERSLAIKCPTVAVQLIGTKKIQQILANPGVVERFISDKAAVQRIRKTFTGLYSLDHGPEGDQTVKMALEDPEKFVLKPQREGGGHNLFGEDIKTTINKEDRSQYILMDKIRSPSVKNYIVRPELSKPIFTDVVNEVGIYGVYLSVGEKIIVNKIIGHMVRTKGSEHQDGSISSGISSYDSPYLF